MEGAIEVGGDLPTVGFADEVEEGRGPLIAQRRCVEEQVTDALVDELFLRDLAAQPGFYLRRGLLPPAIQPGLALLVAFLREAVALPQQIVIALLQRLFVGAEGRCRIGEAFVGLFFAAAVKGE